MGYDVGTANKYLYNFSTGSVVIQCWPNSDDPRAATSGNNREKYLLFNLTNNNTSARKWWQFYIATENIANPSGYDYLNLNKGSYIVSVRGGTSSTSYDGQWIFDSGSYYNWTQKDPITIAFSQDGTTGMKASLNGNTMSVIWDPRNDQTNYNGNDLFSQIDNGYNETLNFGWDKYHFNAIANSGSWEQYHFYSASLSQEELNTITGQIWGEEINILDKQPQLLYKFREEYKVNKDTSLESYEIGNASYNSLGTDTPTQLTTATGGQTNLCTSGSVIDSGIQDYQERI